MKVVTSAGAIELGTVETAPTIGVIDYSRRVTDEFGVTTVVQRGFARRMTVRLAVPFDDVDAIQRQLAQLRATSATWIADDRFGSLSVHGFYKEFEVDHATVPLSYCTLTVEGMTGEEAFTDDGSDPAPAGQASSLQLLQPIVITDAVLTSSSVSEDDAIEWTAAGGYALGQRVIRRQTHRVWESLIERNVGHDPATTTGALLDVGPTNRWAMFDQALGSVTTDEVPIVVTLRPGPAASGLAILDCNAAAVRVQASGYDRTVAPTGGSGAALFLDLSLAAGASITVTLTPFGKAATRVVWDDGFAWDDSVTWQDTVAGTATAEPPSWSDAEGVSDLTNWQDSRGGDGTVFVGTLLLGILRPLGITEGSATSGITDYSRRETDEFGETMIVPRAWAKRMAGKALIRTDAVDQVVGRIAAVRAVPSLWLGGAGVDSLIVYGFFKDFSVEVGETLSKLTLSIEGFSEAKTPAPLTIPWENVSGTKPTENADNTGENTSKDTGAVAGVPATQVIADAASVKQRNDILENITIPAINSAVAAANALIKAAGLKADAVLADLNARLLASGIVLDAALASADNKLVQARVAAELATSRANARIDAAMTDLNAEANRAQGKDELLERRIDSLTVVTNKNDGEVRALIETERLVRTDDVRAIAQRIDTVVTDYTSRDSVTNTRITTQVTALSAADRALGERIDTVTTEFKAADSATSTRITDSVAALSAADEAIGKRVDSIVTDVTTKDTATRAEISRVELASSTRDTALGQRIDSVVTDYTGRDSATNTRITTQVTALSSANLALGERIDTVTTDFKAADAATSARITDSVTSLSAADAALGRRIDSIVAEGGFDDTAVRSEITRVETASASRDNALGSRIDTITTDYKDRDSATNTRITQTAASLSNADAAIGRRIDSVTTDYKGLNTSTNTRISTEVAALSDADTAIGQRIDTLIAQGGGGSEGVDTVARAEISRVETAGVTRDNALAQSISLVGSSFVGGGGNLLSNSTWATAPAGYLQPGPYLVPGWSFAPFGTGAAQIDQWGKNVPGGFFPSPDNALHTHQSGKNQDAYGDWRSDPISIKPGQRYNATALINCHACDVQLLLIFYDGGGTVVFSPGAVVTQINGPGSNLSGYRLANILAEAPGNAVRAALWVRKLPTSENASQNDSSAWFTRPMISEASPTQTGANAYAPGSGSAEQLATNARVDQQATALSDATTAFAQRSSNIEAAAGTLAARVGNTETAVSDGRFATAQRVAITEATVNNVVGRVSTVETAVSDGRFAASQRVQTLESNYNGTAATVSTQAGTIAGLQARTSAYWRTTAVAGNNRAQITISADANAGAGVDIIGDVGISGDLLVAGSIRSAKMGASSVQQTMFLTLPNSLSIPYS